MPTNGEVTGVAVGAGLMLLFIIGFPLLALLCRHLRGRESQIRRWGPADPVLVPPCYCYATVWVDLCPCLEPRLEKFLPKDISKTGQTSLVLEVHNGVVPKSVRQRPDSPINSTNAALGLVRPLTDVKGGAIVANQPTPHARNLTSPNEKNGKSSLIVQITVASSETSANKSTASLQVVDHGHVNMAMEENIESEQ